MRFLAVPALLVFFSVLAGCAAPGEPAAPAAANDTLLLTSPDDVSFAAADMGTDARWHVHDYWGGEERLLVVDAPREFGFACSGCDGGALMSSTRPEPKRVIPQGAQTVLVTLSWTEEEGDHGPITLYVKSADAPELVPFAVVESGVPVAINSTNDMNDPPHQVLSLWQFGMGTIGADGGGTFSFRGTVTFRVEAVRGLEIPAYPPHPDLWNGATELPLLGVAQSVGLMYQRDGNTNCLGGCLGTYAPQPGAIVPYDAGEVVVTIAYGPGIPATLGLAYHAADTWDLAPLEGAMVEAGVYEFRVPVTVGNADSPYAKQSLWEFNVFIDQPTPVRAWSGEFTLTGISLHK